MNNDELKAVFDQQASSYNKQWTRMAPIYNGLYFLLESVFAGLPAKARVLCVGVGTGKELLHLANKFHGWQFTAVEPSSAMLDVCRREAEKAGIASRCHFHEGYLDSLPAGKKHDAATCFLVSQFILEEKARSEFFLQIAERLKPEGVLVNADLSAEIAAESYDALLRVWHSAMAPSDASDEGLSRMRATYAKDVAVLSPASVVSIISSGGFGPPVQFFQAGLIHAWFAKRTS
ncbi:class I SAM-dependent methyltransferase [Geomonas terrae]|uniref:Class I SAM-dependent methyltransferase n=1 Tax=Geomonas terrae TaxID=2562681 RepID=A0A4S1CBH8_9BACT|nr:class I SAM-dependent methyltransferase [Geomonas terrae]TGU70718.1 class I SAM-dependent methyltransferase [Geomonas terrae]